MWAIPPSISVINGNTTRALSSTLSLNNGTWSVTEKISRISPRVPTLLEWWLASFLLVHPLIGLEERPSWSHPSWPWLSPDPCSRWCPTSNPSSSWGLSRVSSRSECSPSVSCGPWKWWAAIGPPTPAWACKCRGYFHGCFCLSWDTSCQTGDTCNGPQVCLDWHVPLSSGFYQKVQNGFCPWEDWRKLKRSWDMPAWLMGDLCQTLGN